MSSGVGVPPNSGADTHASLPLGNENFSADLRAQLALKLFAFTVCYFLFGLVFLRLRLWNPQDWPLFMKRAAAGSTEYEIWPAGSAPAPYPDEVEKTTRRRWWWGGKKRGNDMANDADSGAAWLEMVDRTARGEGSNEIGGDEGLEVVPERTYRSISTGGLPGIGEEQGINEPVRHIPTGTAAAIPPPSPPPIRKMRTSGLLLLGLTGFLLMLLWPVFFVWAVIWWTVYSVWAIHYIYISTRRPRAIAQAHSGVITHLSPPNDAVLVVTEITITTEPRTSRTQPEPQQSGSGTPSAAVFDDEDEDTRPYGYTATATAADDNKPSRVAPGAEIRTAGELNSFYPQVGRISRKIKTLLGYDSTMAMPKWCRAALLAAERRRRDILDRAAGVGLPSHTPILATASNNGISSSGANGVRSQNADGNVVSHGIFRGLNNGTNENNSRNSITGISRSRIPTRRSSFQQHELIRQEGGNGYGQGNKYDNRQTRREPRMTNSPYTWQRQREFDDEEAIDGVEVQSLTPATFGKPRSSSASYDNKTCGKDCDGVAVSKENNVRHEMPKPKPIPSRL